MNALSLTCHFVNTAAQKTVSFSKKSCEKTTNAAKKIFNGIFPVNPVTKSRQFRVIPTSVEKYYGKNFYNTTCPKYKINEELTAKYQPVFNNLAKHCDRKNLDYEFRVMKSNTVNAFCLPGGKIAVTTALINRINCENITDDEYDFSIIDHEDKMAAVLGHEITHAAAGHTAMKLQFAILLYVTGKVLSFAIGLFVFHKVVENDRKNGRHPYRAHQNAQLMATLSQLAFTTFWELGKLLINNQYGHCQEHQSDRIGMKYAAKAGYNPLGAVWIQEMFVENFGKGSKKLALFSTHPPSKDRVSACKQTLKKIEEEGAEAITR